MEVRWIFCLDDDTEVNTELYCSEVDLYKEYLRFGTFYTDVNSVVENVGSC